MKIEQIIFELFSFSSHNNKAKLKVCLDILKEDITRAFNSKNFWGNSKSTSKNVFFYFVADLMDANLSRRLLLACA